jgi:hypothetical protein
VLITCQADVMILRYQRLSRYPRVFQSMTGLPLALFTELWADLQPRLRAAHQQRLQRATRTRAIGAGHPFDLDLRDQVLLTVVWLRQYTTHETLAYLFGISNSTVSRIMERVLPTLEAAGCDTMRLPDPGKKHRRTLDALLHDTPDLLVMIDTFEQRVQRPRNRTAADQLYSGKKKQHTLKSHVAVNETTGQIVDVADSVAGPTADINLLAQSRLLERLPAGVGAGGDLAYVGLAALHPQGLAATPRRKPRGNPRSPDDVAYNQAFARRWVVVEHTIRRLRCYQALNQLDRHHRRHHTTRVRAVAGLVNRRLGRRWRS